MRSRLALVMLLALAPSAHANGRYPTPVDVHFQPGNDDVIALAATWGLLVSQDGGETFGWICEGGVGFGGVYDPDYAFTPTGLLLATTTSNDGLRLTRDFCSWAPAPAPLGSPDGGATPATFVSQVEVGPDGTIFAMAAAGKGVDSRLYRSLDDGESFAVASLPRDVDWWETLLVAPTLLAGDETRLYLTGYDLVPSKTRFLLRSDDGGDTWTNLPVTDFTFGGNLTDLQLAAVSPADPDLVFARVFQQNGTTVGDAIYRSDDAGATWTKVFEADDDIPVVLVRGNGDVVVATRLNTAASPSSGVRVSTDGGETFGAPVLGPTAYCLRERADGTLFACGDGFVPELMALGTGTVPGTYTSILDFSQVDDVLACPDGSTVAGTCNPLWCGVTLQFGIPGFEDECAIPDAGPMPDAAGDPPKETCTDCSGGGPGGMATLAVVVVLPMLRRRRRKSSSY